jgi:hypothetical protein
VLTRGISVVCDHLKFEIDLFFAAIIDFMSKNNDTHIIQLISISICGKKYRSLTDHNLSAIFLFPFNISSLSNKPMHL